MQQDFWDATLAPFDLTLVFRRIEMAERSGDKALAIEPPFLEPADMNLAARTAGPCVRSNQRPAVDGLRVVARDVVHQHLHVWQIAHEPARDIGYRRASNRRHAVIDLQR